MGPNAGKLLGIVGICIWSLVPVLIVLNKDLSLTLLVGGSCIANGLVYVIEWKLSKKNLSEIFNLSPIPVLIVIAVMSFIRFLYWGGLQSINAIEAMLLHNLWVILIVIGSSVIITREVSFKEASVLMTIFVSVALMLSDTETLFDHANTWHLGVFLTAFVWALYVLYCQFSQMFKGSEPAIAGLIIGIVCLSIVALNGDLNVNLWALLSITLIGIFNRVGHMLWTKAMNSGTQNFETISTYGMILVGILFVSLFGLAALDFKLVIVTILIVSAGFSVSTLSDKPLIKINKTKIE